MNNLYAGSGLQPKYIIADIDTYRKGPEDDTYANFPVNYLKIDKMPGPDEDFSPMLKALRDGNFFVTTGEILIKNYSRRRHAATQRTITADVEWTFPLEFVEVVWGDGKKIDRQIISATDLGRVRHQALRDSVRRHGQGVGAVRGLGFGRQRRVRPAGVADHAGDDANGWSGQVRGATADWYGDAREKC